MPWPDKSSSSQRAVPPQRRVLAAHVGIRNDDVTVLGAAEHHARALQGDAEHFHAPAKECEFWHVPLSYMRERTPRLTGEP